MRDLIVSLFILGTLPTCYRRPFIGLLMFTLLAYMRVQDLTWGFARYQRWSFYVAIVTLVGFLMSKEDKRFMLNDIRCWIMVTLALLVGASLVASGELTTRDINIYVEYWKIIGVALFTTGVVKNLEYFRILIWVIALSFGFFGVKSGLQMILSGGSLVIIQGPGGMLSDNNDFALAMCMSLPWILHIGLAERRTILRRTMIAIVPLSVLTIAATHSRGAFLSLTVTSLLLVWRSQNRVAGFAIFFLAAIAAVIAAPQSYKDRISTISEYETEGSAKGRLDAWKVAFHMIEARPLLGVGFEKFQQNYKRFDPNATDEGQGGPGTRVTHNSYLEIWSECGTPAFLLYLCLIGLSYVDLWKLRAEAKLRYHSSWILSYTTMFEASLTAFVVGSMFLNRAHFDLFYHLVTIIVVFGVLARAAMKDERAYPVRFTGRGVLALQRTGGFGARPRANGFGRAATPHGGFDGGLGGRPAFTTS
jgi:probable O-glycosylation ligase (exosortase A-associated)